MVISKPIARALFLLLGLTLVAPVILVASGCVIAEPREGFYDHDHHRWWHEHGWHECHDRDEHCHD